MPLLFRYMDFDKSSPNRNYPPKIYSDTFFFAKLIKILEPI